MMKKEDECEYIDKNLSTIQNDTIIRAAKGYECTHIPVWLMRQAGRYLPEYKLFSKDKNFFDVCRNPEWACCITLQPINRFPLDAAIIFSDILVLPQSLGWDFVFVPDNGPQCIHPLRDLTDLLILVDAFKVTLPISDQATPIDENAETYYEHLLQKVDYSMCEKLVEKSLIFVFDAISLTKRKLQGRIPLIGFAGAPWTLFIYMTEGKGSKLCCNAKRWLYKYPTISKYIFEILANCISTFLIRQIDAGASLVQIFESHAGELPGDLFHTFCTSYLKKIAKTIKQHRPSIPIILFCKGNIDFNLGGPDLYDVISIDSKTSLIEARKLSDGRFSLQGNFDPALLHAPEDHLKKKIRDTIESLSSTESFNCRIPRRYIANLGHGVTPDIDPNAVQTFIETIHNF